MGNCHGSGHPASKPQCRSVEVHGTRAVYPGHYELPVRDSTWPCCPLRENLEYPGQVARVPLNAKTFSGLTGWR